MREPELVALQPRVIEIGTLQLCVSEEGIVELRSIERGALQLCIDEQGPIQLSAYSVLVFNFPKWVEPGKAADPIALELRLAQVGPK